MLFLWYPKCTTCQKAKAFLDERGVSYEARDIKLENPTAEELRGWWEKSGMPLKKFFNTSGLQYKALGLKDKLPEMSEEEQLALLAADKGCVYLDLWETLADGEGNLKEMIAAPDGVHLSAGNGYGAWVTYLRNHAKYSANNPWIMGSAYSAE